MVQKPIKLPKDRMSSRKTLLKLSAQKVTKTEKSSNLDPLQNLKSSQLYLTEEDFSTISKKKDLKFTPRLAKSKSK